MHKALIDLAVSAIADMPLAEKVAALNEARGYPDGIPDESDIKLENAGKAAELAAHLQDPSSE